jgi:hypothetical protein
MWTLFESLRHYENIEEYAYEELSKASLASLLDHDFDNMLIDLERLYSLPNKHTKLGEKSTSKYPKFFDLNSYEIKNELSKHKANKVDYLLGYVGTLEYTNKTLNALNILNDQGFALILIPSLDYQKVKCDLKEHGFFINAILGSADSRDSTNLNDLSWVIPIHCKYLGLAISRKEFDCLYVHTEGYFDYDLDYPEKLINGVKPTNRKDIYKNILTNDEVFVNDKDFIGLNHFYAVNQVNNELSKYRDFQEYKFIDIANIVSGFYYNLIELLKVLDNYKTTDKEDCLEHITELMDSVQTDMDPEYKYFDLDQASIERYDELNTALIQVRNQLMTGDNLNIPKYFNQFNSWLSIEVYSYKYKPNEIRIEPYKDKSQSDINEEFHYSENYDHSSISVFIDNNIILTEYLELYLSTKLGELSVNLAALEADQENLGNAWKDIKILAPSIGDQRVVVSALNKLNKLESEIVTHKDELASNPFNAGSINLDLDDWLSRLGKLSTSEDSLYLINKGESDTVEFKETLSFNLKSKQQTPATKKEMELSVLKTIVGFLNKRGGTLFIGVADDGTVSGIDNDLHNFHKNSADKLLLHFKNILKERIGDQYLSFWRYEVITLNGNNIIRMDCIPTLDPCFYESGRFFVRTNPATVELKGTDMVSYMKTRFKE